MNPGIEFEQYVISLLKKAGHLWVRHNVVKEVKHQKKLVRRCQIDIQYFSLDTLAMSYVECKYRETKPVELEDIAKFSAVLELLRIDARQAEFITNTSYARGVQTYADMKKISLKSIEQLESEASLINRLRYYGRKRT